MKLRKVFYLIITVAALAVHCSSGSEQNKNSGKVISGKQIYEKYCSNCHGATGDLRLSGAKDLKKSTLALPLIIEQVTLGKGAMVAYEELLSPEEIRLVSEYILSFRK